MNDRKKEDLSGLETEIKLLINQRLYEKKIISSELFEQAKALILKPAKNRGSAMGGRSGMETKNY